MKKFALILILALISVVTFSQGIQAQWRKDGNKTWFQDAKTYNGFGTVSPTHTWNFIGEVYSTLKFTAPLGVITTINAKYTTSDSVTVKYIKVTAVTDTTYKRVGLIVIGTDLYYGNGTKYKKLN